MSNSKRNILTPLLLIPALSLLAPTSANAGDCLEAGILVDCEYPPFEDDFGAVANTTGLDDGRAATPADLVDDILHRVTIPRNGFYGTLDGSGQLVPTASCNDGSPAVMYVREATDPSYDDKWVIVLEGGGAGFDAAGGVLDDGMWARWTGSAVDNKLDWYRKTSTDWKDTLGNFGGDGIPDTPEELYVGGILDSTNSAFSEWNWVFMNYCSSDLWTGRVKGHPLPDAGSWTDGGVLKEGFKMDFSGHINLEAGLALLRRNFVWGTDVDANYTMPDIDNASTVLLAGESAGGGGVRFNLDYVQYALDSHNPGVEVYGSVGAGLRPEVGDPANAWFRDLTPADGIDDFQVGSENLHAQLQLINGFLDQSCEASYGDWTCTLGYFTGFLEEFSTPVFFKQDLSDNQMNSAYSPSSDFTDGVRQAFDDFDTLIAPPPYFGPNCGGHETLTSPKHYTQRLEKFNWNGVAVGPSTGQFMSYNDALEAFVDSGVTDPSAYAGKVVGGAGQFIWLPSC